MIGEKRFFHSLGSLHLAVALADRYGEDLLKAATAGLLHDCGRLPNIEMVEAEARRRNLTLPPEERPYAKVWHALLSAEMAEHDFGVSDPEVLRAILIHPTGDADMSRFEQIIFLADYLEPMRGFEGLNELRKLAESDLGQAFRCALRGKIKHVQGQGRALHPRSLRALESVGGNLT